MTRKAIFGKALLVAIISLGTLGTGQMAAAGTPVSASCMAESPTDGSVWMGTIGQGLYRLGRNGRQIKYTAVFSYGIAIGKPHESGYKTFEFTKSAE